MQRSLPPIEAPADLLATARENCAARLRARGNGFAAELIATGAHDDCWAMRHEVRKLQAEQGSVPA